MSTKIPPANAPSMAQGIIPVLAPEGISTMEKAEQSKKAKKGRLHGLAFHAWSVFFVGVLVCQAKWRENTCEIKVESTSAIILRLTIRIPT